MRSVEEEEGTGRLKKKKGIPEKRATERGGTTKKNKLIFFRLRGNEDQNRPNQSRIYKKCE